VAVTCGGANVRVSSNGCKRARCVVLLILLGLAMPGTETGQKNKAALATQPAPVRLKSWATAGLPLSFEPNEGQTDSRVKFLSRGSGYTFFLAADEAVLALRKSEVRSQKSGARSSKAETGNSKFETRNSGQLSLFPVPGSLFASLDPPAPSPESRAPAVLGMKLVGANQAAKVTALDELPGKSNYFIGTDPKKWRTDVPTYGKVKYEGVYPGVDLVYYGNQRQLEYDFVVAPGADPKAIALKIETGKSKIENPKSKIHIDASGDLVIETDGGEVRFHKPVLYQPTGSLNSQFTIRNSELLNGHYVLTADNRIGFEVSRYDKSKPLVIDPVLSYSTYLGGSGGDVAYGVAVDSSGEAFVTGITNSADFPTLAASGSSVYQSSNKGNGDAFVTKINPTGTALVYSTYLGGSGSDTATAIAVSASGDAFVTGTTTSADFPTASTATTGAFQTAYGGNGDAFVAQLSSDGSKLVYSSYLGGTGADFGQGIAVDSSGNAYVTGSTQSVNFPTCPGPESICAAASPPPLQASSGGSSDAFVAEVNFTGSQLVYSTYLGGTQADVGRAIRVDASGNAYVTGYTFSPNFPMTLSPLQGSNAGPPDVFVSEVKAGGSALAFSTYLGGSGDDRGFGIALDTSGSIYVTGISQSTDFPTTSAAWQTMNHGQGDAFVSKLNSTGAALTYSTFLGGSRLDQGNAIAVDSSGNAFVTGSTQSGDFPTAEALQAILGISGGSSCGTTLCADAFVSQLNPSGSALVYSTYLGGSKADFGQAIALDSSGDPYVAGSTSSTNFPAIAGAYQGSLTGAGTAFVAKVDSSNTPGIALAPAKVNFGNQPLGVRSAVETATVINAGTAPLSITQITSSSTDFAEADNCVGTVAGGGGTCTINLTFTPSTTGSETDQITITDNAAGSPHIITVTGTGVTSATAVTVSPTSLTFAGQTVGTVSSPKTVTITNTGTSTLDISSISATPSSDFSQTNTCAATLNQLAVGQSCTASVSFAPTASGARSGTLSISDNAAGSPQSVALGGTGLAVFSVSSTSSTTTAVIGSASATFTVSASAPAGFTGSITLSCSSGATCAFSPASIFGGQTSTLTLSGLTASTANPFNFTVNGTSGSQTATLPLTVLFSDYSLSASPALDTIVSGASANYTVVVSPLNGFNQGVQMGCSKTSLPPGSSCTFSSSTVTPKGSPATVTLTLQTTKTTSAPMKPWKPFSGSPPPLGLWFACIGLVWNLIRLGQRYALAGTMAGPRRIWFRFALLTFVLALAAFWGSCRSLSSTPGGTAIGNYSITITGTLGSNTAVVRSTTVNLSVTPVT